MCLSYYLRGALLSPGLGWGSATGCHCLCIWTGSLQEDRAWNHLSHSVSPALPSKEGPQLRVWLNEKMLLPLPSWAPASAQNPEGGQLAPLTAAGLNTPFPLGQAQWCVDTKGPVGVPHPPEAPRVGTNTTTNLSVGESTGTGEIRLDFIHSTLRQARKEGEDTGRTEALEPSQAPGTQALPCRAAPCPPHPDTL